MISKQAEDPSRFVQELFFTRNARTAWGHLLESYKAVAEPRILLPSYIGYTEREGSGVFDPVKALDVPYEFYCLGDNLNIDLEEFERVIKENSINIALVIHYFGFCRNQMESINNICLSNNVILVEDCAHAYNLWPKPGSVGTFGDYSFYSIHKHIATSSGGILKVNRERFKLQTLDVSKKATADVLEQLIKTEMDSVAQIRRRNFAIYEAQLSSLDGLVSMYHLKKEDVPQTFPIRVKNMLREKLYFYLMEKNIITISLYYRLIDEIQESRFPNSFSISREILNLPVHQDITEEDVDAVCRGIFDFFKTRG